MPTTRKRVSRRAGSRITRAVVAAFTEGDRATLDSLLGVKPWEPSPMEADSPKPPDWAKGDGTAWTANWSKAFELRQEIERAAA